jgi:DNA-binding MarR family transcriptional regulator
VLEVITHFVDNGIVAKRKSKKDKRVKYIYLTEIGEVLASTNTLESQRAVEKMIDILSKKEIKTLVKIFDKFGSEQK